MVMYQSKKGLTRLIYIQIFKINYVGSDDRTVRLWDLPSGHCKYTLACHSCADLKFDQQKVVTASFDNTLSLWEWASGNCLVKYHGHIGAGEN